MQANISCKYIFFQPLNAMVINVGTEESCLNIYQALLAQLFYGPSIMSKDSVSGMLKSKTKLEHTREEKKPKACTDLFQVSAGARALCGETDVGIT